MNTNNNIGIAAFFDKKIRSIGESAEFLMNVIKALNDVDLIFSRPVLGKNNKSEVLIDLSKSDDENTNTIADTIIYFLKSDIKRYNNEPNPTKLFSRPEGFGIVLTYEYGDDKVSFRVGLGGDIFTAMNTLICNVGKKNTDFFVSLVKKLSKFTFFDAKISFQAPDFNNGATAYQSSFGWITYISNQNPVQIPTNITTLELEKIENGFLFYASKDNITTDENAYKLAMLKTLYFMEQLALQVPTYRRV